MMQDDLFNNLPPENIIDILSRLPVKYILRCKSVCKPWIDLIESPEFANLHLSRSVPGLAVGNGLDRPNPNRIGEFVDDLDLKNSSRYYNLLFSFNFASELYLHSSVDGLLLMYDLGSECTQSLLDLYICNPITREYFELPSLCKIFQKYSLGFGVSKTAGQYKVVVFCGCKRTEGLGYTECEVYTLGTLSWRSIVVDNPLYYIGEVGVFLNGNLHWVVWDFLLISCFDLETEQFSTFRSPSECMHYPYTPVLSTLSDCLCLCDGFDGGVVVWLMKKYEDEKSWTKEYIIKIPHFKQLWGSHFPVKVFKDGDLLFTSRDTLEHIWYSKKNGTIQETEPLPLEIYHHSQTNAIYTPSFLSLERFASVLPGKEKQLFTVEIVCPAHCDVESP